MAAVQVMPVMQPSSWQKEYSRFNATQQALLAHVDAHAAPGFSDFGAEAVARHRTKLA